MTNTAESNKSIHTGKPKSPKLQSGFWIGPLSVLVFLVAWEMICRIAEIPPYILPSPSQILASVKTEYPALWHHSLVTMYETLLGLGLSVLVGVTLAIAMDLSPLLGKILHPLMVISQSVPIIALAPILMIYLGFGLAPKILAVVLMCFYPITISFREGMSEVNPGYVRLLKNMGATKADIYRFVKIPSAFVSLFAGLRVSATYAISGALVGEWLSSQAGLGYYMLRQNSAFRLDRVFATVLVIVFWSLILTSLARGLQFLCTPGKGFIMKNIRKKQAGKFGFVMRAFAGLLSLGLAAGMLTACSDGTYLNGTPDDTKPQQTRITKDKNPNFKDVTVILDYTINTNHSGLFAALENGYYADEELNVEIIEPADGVTLQLLAAGKGTIGVTYQEDLSYAKSSDSPLPVKAIATILQHNTSGFASIKSKNITSAKDFVGKTYAGWGAESEAVVLRAVMAKAGVDPDSVHMISASSATYASLEKTIDFMWFFEGWDVIAAKQAGFDLNYIPCRALDERLDYYTPIMVAREETLEEDPELVKAFMRATAKGYDFASDKNNVDAIVDILSTYSVDADKQLLKASQEFLADEYSRDASQWGIMKDEVWDGYTEFMVENGLIEKAVPAAEMYTNDFLPKK